ncbi:ATP synthase subunit C [Alkalibacter saccharofermentans]|jgi:V/A-type H+-transporting ATPase subunit K|uniref:V/A-type H+-transporting ATPase subunit K n=1 Tax=Alkalibacter saccharofermentans DSM 14828 TaxID=1120975 RepID=A0A1M4XAA0_9FIRM|nr:ATP synthase subunit C [Alkalibacter saccharofermentans]SHE90305.1 V/A-type H+-transporting ATPase subunit K [Alkalibacter saccharofermentans DSM 14828]
MLNFILYSAVIIIFATISAGVYYLKKGCVENRKLKKFLQMNLSLFIPMMMGAVLILIPDVVRASEGADSNAGLGYLGAALATGLACLGSGVAVGNVGSAALGAISEDEKMLGKTLIYVGLAEGIAIYGLVISIMILGAL